MKKMIAMLSIFIFLPAHAALHQDVKNSLVGTWKLVSITKESLHTSTKINDYGPNPKGYLHYSPDGRMMVIIVQKDRKKPGNKIPADEAALLFNTMTSYAGTYTVHENQIIHHIDVAWNPSWTGTHQVRFYKLTGKHLTLTMVPADQTLQKTTVLLEWEKLN